MKNFKKYNVKIAGKVGELFEEAIMISKENPAKVLERMIIDYHMQITKKEKVHLDDNSELSLLKVGKIANIHLRSLLETSEVSSKLLESMQNMEYSKKNFDLQYPLLVRDGTIFETIRYYKTPLFIKNEKFYLCSQWFESSINDDKSYLLYWMKEFQKTN